MIYFRRIGLVDQVSKCEELVWEWKPTSSTVSYSHLSAEETLETGE